MQNSDFFVRKCVPRIQKHVQKRGGQVEGLKAAWGWSLDRV